MYLTFVYLYGAFAVVGSMCERGLKELFQSWARQGHRRALFKRLGVRYLAQW